MASEALHDVLEQNKENLKTLLRELDADYEFPGDPEKEARMRKAFSVDPERAKDVDMTEEEEIAWLFEENAKALAAATEAVSGERASADAGKSTGLGRIASALSEGK